MRLAGEIDPALILADMVLPAAAGIAAIAANQRRPCPAKLVATSGAHGAGLDQLLCAGELGADFILHKRFCLAELRAVLCDCLDTP